jgi:phosphoglycolate phosphatase-like HAD superfamily hydrolase
MQYTNIVFDIDGTLIDTQEAMLRSLQRTVQEADGRTLEVDDLRFIFGMTAEDALRSLGIKDVACVFLMERTLSAKAKGAGIPGIEAVP